MMYLLTAIGLSPDGSSTVHIYTKTIHGTTQITTNLEECGPCPVFASFTLAFALQLRRKHGKTSVRVNKTSVKVRKTSVRVKILSQSKKPQSEYIILGVCRYSIICENLGRYSKYEIGIEVTKK